MKFHYYKNCCSQAYMNKTVTSRKSYSVHLIQVSRENVIFGEIEADMLCKSVCLV